MDMFYNSAYKKEKYYIAQYMYHTSMQEAVEDHLFYKTKNISMVISHTSMKDDIGVQHIEQSTQ